MRAAIGQTVTLVVSGCVALAPRWTMQLPSSQLQPFIPGVTASGEKVCVVGATGYIGKFVVQECLRRKYPTTAVVRSSKIRDTVAPYLSDAHILTASPTDRQALLDVLAPAPPDVIICCLASRSGTKSDSQLVDYQASVNCLEVARELGSRHFVLLSAFCVAKPWLQFQFAKLQTEDALAAQSDVSYSIVRPTAFLKSVSGQVEIVKDGGPFVFFDLGQGRSAVCNPIAESDLAKAIVDCVCDPSKSSQGGNPIWNIGGPDPGYSMSEQGQLIADAVAEVNGDSSSTATATASKKSPWLLPVPIGLFDVIINTLDFFADVFNSTKLSDAAEFGRIGKYYAVEDMHTTDPAEKYGQIKLYDHYVKVVREGQEYDPYTTVFASMAGKKSKSEREAQNKIAASSS